MPASSKILDLRNLLAERFPQPAPPTEQQHVATGVATLDAATEGGLPKGGITELITPHWSAGSALLIYRLLETARDGRYFVALIDGRDSFDPQSAGETLLHNLLWVRCRQSHEAVKAADLLLRDGNFPLVILDLVLNAAEELRKIPQTTWYRLQRLVEPLPTAFLVLTRRSMIGSAQLKLVLENRWHLCDLQAGDHSARLKFHIQRRHAGRERVLQAG